MRQSERSGKGNTAVGEEAGACPAEREESELWQRLRGSWWDGIDLRELPSLEPDGVLLLQTAAQLLLLWTLHQSLPLLLHRSVPAPLSVPSWDGTPQSHRQERRAAHTMGNTLSQEGKHSMVWFCGSGSMTVLVWTQAVLPVLTELCNVGWRIMGFCPSFPPECYVAK